MASFIPHANYNQIYVNVEPIEIKTSFDEFQLSHKPKKQSTVKMEELKILNADDITGTNISVERSLWINKQKQIDIFNPTKIQIDTIRKELADALMAPDPLITLADSSLLYNINELIDQVDPDIRGFMYTNTTLADLAIVSCTSLSNAKIVINTKQTFWPKLLQSFDKIMKGASFNLHDGLLLEHPVGQIIVHTEWYQRYINAYVMRFKNESINVIYDDEDEFLDMLKAAKGKCICETCAINKTLFYLEQIGYSRFLRSFKYIEKVDNMCTNEIKILDEHNLVNNVLNIENGSANVLAPQLRFYQSLTLISIFGGFDLPYCASLTLNLLTNVIALFINILNSFTHGTQHHINHMRSKISVLLSSYSILNINSFTTPFNLMHDYFISTTPNHFEFIDNSYYTYTLDESLFSISSYYLQFNVFKKVYGILTVKGTNLFANVFDPVLSSYLVQNPLLAYRLTDVIHNWFNLTPTTFSYVTQNCNQRQKSILVANNLALLPNCIIEPCKVEELITFVQHDTLREFSICHRFVYLFKHKINYHLNFDIPLLISAITLALNSCCIITYSNKTFLYVLTSHGLVLFTINYSHINYVSSSNIYAETLCYIDDIILVYQYNIGSLRVAYAGKMTTWSHLKMKPPFLALTYDKLALTPMTLSRFICLEPKNQLLYASYILSCIYFPHHKIIRKKLSALIYHIILIEQFTIFDIIQLYKSHEFKTLFNNVNLLGCQNVADVSLQYDKYRQNKVYDLKREIKPAIKLICTHMDFINRVPNMFVNNYSILHFIMDPDYDMSFKHMYRSISRIVNKSNFTNCQISLTSILLSYHVKSLNDWRKQYYQIQIDDRKRFLTQLYLLYDIKSNHDNDINLSMQYLPKIDVNIDDMPIVQSIPDPNIILNFATQIATEPVVNNGSCFRHLLHYNSKLNPDRARNMNDVLKDVNRVLDNNLSRSYEANYYNLSKAKHDITYINVDYLDKRHCVALNCNNTACSHDKLDPYDLINMAANTNIINGINNASTQLHINATQKHILTNFYQHNTKEKPVYNENTNNQRRRREYSDQDIESQIIQVRLEHNRSVHHYQHPLVPHIQLNKFNKPKIYQIPGNQNKNNPGINFSNNNIGHNLNDVSDKQSGGHSVYEHDH